MVICNYIIVKISDSINIFYFLFNFLKINSIIKKILCIKIVLFPYKQFSKIRKKSLLAAVPNTVCHNMLHCPFKTYQSLKIIKCKICF